MSRPVPHSTPKGWAALIPPNSPIGFPPRSLIAFGSSLYGLIPNCPAMNGPKMAMA